MLSRSTIKLRALLVDVEPHLDPAALCAHVEVAEEAVQPVPAVVPDVGPAGVADKYICNVSAQ